jgi:hypothetical protein
MNNALRARLTQFHHDFQHQLLPLVEADHSVSLTPTMARLLRIWGTSRDIRNRSHAARCSVFPRIVGVPRFIFTRFISALYPRFTLLFRIVGESWVSRAWPPSIESIASVLAPCGHGPDAQAAAEKEVSRALCPFDGRVSRHRGDA